MSLKHRTTRGIGWTFASQVTRLVVTFTVTAILAHLLSPRDFGLMAMVVVFMNVFLVMNDMGLPAALIQKKEITEEHISSAFWLNLAEGLVLTGILALLSPVIAGFYGRSALTAIVLVLSTTLFISSFGMIQLALFSKDLDFKLPAVAEIISVVLSGGVAVAMAYGGSGVWSLVGQAVSYSVLLAALLWFMSGWTPKFIFRWSAAWELLSFGLHLMGFGLVNYFNRNLDNLLIGKFEGAATLGFYNLAYRLLLFPLQSISTVIGRVMFPALSTIQDNKEKVRQGYISANRYIATITFPLMTGLAILAPQFVRVFFGIKWDRSIFLIQVLAFAGLFQSVETTVGWLFQSQGRTDILLKWGIFSAAVCAGAFGIGLLWSAEGVAVAYLIVELLLLWPTLWLAFRLIDLKVFRFMRSLFTIALATAGMAVVTLGVRLALEKLVKAGDLVTLLVSAVVGTVTFVLLLLALDRPLVRELAAIPRLVASRAEVPPSEPLVEEEV